MNAVKRIVAALVGASALLAGAAMAQDKPVELRISLWVPPAHPLVPSTKDWAADIEKASGGSIKAVIFPSEQLGRSPSAPSA
jgi:TRAP-type C4-dicarboxylate transport system substrate-binding protein